MKRIKQSNSFKKDIKRAIKRGKNLQKLYLIVEKLVQGTELEDKHHPHKLAGNYLDKWECHIEPDWLLIYELTNDSLILYRMGSHADLFA